MMAHLGLENTHDSGRGRGRRRAVGRGDGRNGGGQHGGREVRVHEEAGAAGVHGGAGFHEVIEQAEVERLELLRQQSGPGAEPPQAEPPESPDQEGPPPPSPPEADGLHLPPPRLQPPRARRRRELAPRVEQRRWYRPEYPRPTVAAGSCELPFSTSRHLPPRERSVYRRPTTPARVPQVSATGLSLWGSSWQREEAVGPAPSCPFEGNGSGKTCFTIRKKCSINGSSLHYRVFILPILTVVV